MRVVLGLMIGLVGAGLCAKPSFLQPAKAANAAIVKDCKSCHEAVPATKANLTEVGHWLVTAFHKGAGKDKVLRPEDMVLLKDYKPGKK